MKTVLNAFHSYLGHFKVQEGPLTFHHPISVRYSILAQEAGDIPVTPLGLQVSMGGDDSDGSTAPSTIS
ncbi:hypothetical protein EVAR_32297_1 [Eumeta japonica]|uniref:Uncharacterized protein n=1 Tax=Eumeta variegata TaxID=151549 RepID=A0A4C1WD01_EUMVA|nr:hypothetical protein EVAR_32297_1 [Eumeta japonica]